MKKQEESREEAGDCQEHDRDALSVDHLADDCAAPAAADQPGRRRSRVGESLLSAAGLAHGERIWRKFVSLRLASEDRSSHLDATGIALRWGATGKLAPGLAVAATATGMGMGFGC